MHPPLHRPHPDCQHVIFNLTVCHDANPYMKFLGSCNVEKRDLDMCFKEEKEKKRRENARRGREWNKGMERRIKEREDSEK